MKKIIYGFLGCLLLIAMFLGIQRLTDTEILTWNESVTAKQFSENIYNIKETDYLELRLESGKTYGIHVENVTYAMRLWADGRLLAENGTVSDTAEGFVPLIRSNTVYFTAYGDVTVLVMQRVNFNHSYWNTAVIKLGSSDLIEAMV